MGAHPTYGAPRYPARVGYGGSDEHAFQQIQKATKDARLAMLASLVGLATFCCFGGLFLGIFAIVKGNDARRVLDYYNVDEGRSMAQAAAVIGAIDIAITVVFLVVNFASSIIR